MFQSYEEALEILRLEIEQIRRGINLENTSFLDQLYEKALQELKGIYDQNGFLHEDLTMIGNGFRKEILENYDMFYLLLTSIRHFD